MTHAQMQTLATGNLFLFVHPPCSRSLATNSLDGDVWMALFMSVQWICGFGTQLLPNVFSNGSVDVPIYFFSDNGVWWQPFLFLVASAWKAKRCLHGEPLNPSLVRSGSAQRPCHAFCSVLVSFPVVWQPCSVAQGPCVCWRAFQ